MRALAGWNARDFLGREAGELSRDGLMLLVATLRESLAGCGEEWGEEGNAEVKTATDDINRYTAATQAPRRTARPPSLSLLELVWDHFCGSEMGLAL